MLRNELHQADIGHNSVAPSALDMARGKPCVMSKPSQCHTHHAGYGILLSERAVVCVTGDPPNRALAATAEGCARYVARSLPSTLRMTGFGRHI